MPNLKSNHDIIDKYFKLVYDPNNIVIDTPLIDY